MKLFDAHCHLQSPEIFQMAGKIMERAAAAGVERMVCCGTSSADWNQVLQLAEQFPQIIPMVGMHPWFVESRNGSPSHPDNADRPAVEPHLRKENIEQLGKLLTENPSVGVGETGLDFQERFTNRAKQEECFAAHLDLARELNRPVAVHCVRAWGRLIEILREHPAPRILLHAFSGAAELIPELAELNCWFSFCGSVTNPKAKRVRAAVAAVPKDRLLIETDSPDFPPSGCSPPNEPANLVYVALAVAELRGVSGDAIAELSFSNAAKLFHTI